MEAEGVESCWGAWCLPWMVDDYHPKASVEGRAAGPAGRRTRSQSKAAGPRDMDHEGSPKLVQSRCAFPGHFACWPLWKGSVLLLLVTEAGSQMIGECMEYHSPSRYRGLSRSGTTACKNRESE